MKKYKNYLLIVLAILLIVVAILWSSKNAGPDSALYSIRLNYAEKISGLGRSSDFDKANYALDLAQKRLVDLQALKEKKLLDSKNGILARDNFNQQTIVAQQGIIAISQKEGGNSKNALTLTEKMDVEIEGAKAVYNIDQLEVLDEGAPIPKATSSKVKSK